VKSFVSNIRAKRIGELATASAVTRNQSTLGINRLKYGLLGAIAQNMATLEKLAIYKQLLKYS
jgi:hypothetical protein